MEDKVFEESLNTAKIKCKITFDLKQKQLDCIRNVTQQIDTIGLLPTGYGKSLNYGILAPLLDIYHSTEYGHHIVIVVSPLQALMEEQIKKMKDQGISAIYLGSSDITIEQKHGIEEGKFQFVMMSPETLFGGRWRQTFASDLYRERVHVMAVDEAHCIVEWGKEFRREYSRLGEMRAIFTNATVLALTASAPPSMLPMIKKSLALKANATTIVESANRDNIMYIAKEAPTSISDTFQWLVEALQQEKEKSPKTIIYCRSVKAVGKLFTYFNTQLGDDIFVGRRYSANRLVAMFHHSTGKRLKKVITDSFPQPSSNIRIVIATCAFGMGIDCPDITYIINWGASRSFEGFYQESGRGGRTPSMQAFSIVYFHSSDVTERATDQRMRDYCHASDSGITSCCESSDDPSTESESEEDIFGNKVIQTKTKNSNTKNKLKVTCRRKIIIKHLTPSCDYRPMDVLHLCCDLCHSICKCGQCPDIPGLQFDNGTDQCIATLSIPKDIPVRDVTEEQLSLLKTSLDALRTATPHVLGLFGGEVLSGLDESVIKDIMNNAQHIFEEEDLQLYLYDSRYMVKVMDIINDVFN